LKFPQNQELKLTFYEFQIYTNNSKKNSVWPNGGHRYVIQNESDCNF